MVILKRKGRMMVISNNSNAFHHIAITARCELSLKLLIEICSFMTKGRSAATLLNFIDIEIIAFLLSIL